MKTTLGVALVVGLMTMSATAVAGEEVLVPVDEIAPRVYVMNNYLTDVRIYIEDAEGKLHNMGRLSRGSLTSFAVPEEISRGEFRVKVYPAALPGSPFAADSGVKTNPLDAGRDYQVRLWLEPDLTASIVEIARD